MARNDTDPNPAIAGAIDELSLHFDREERSRTVEVGQPLYIRGWAIDARTLELPSRLRVVLDDSPVEIPVTSGLRRDDLADHFGSGVRYAGFEAVVPPVYGAGAHGLHLVGTDASGTISMTCATIVFYALESLAPCPVVPSVRGVGMGFVDMVWQESDPRSPAERAGRNEISIVADAIVRGRAYNDGMDAGYVSIGAVVDGRWYVDGQPGLPYRDKHGIVTAKAGFLIRFVGRAFAPGEHELQVVARTSAGDWVTIDRPQTFEIVEELWPWLWALPEFRQPTRAAITEWSIFDRDGGATIAGRNDRVSVAIQRGHGIFVRGWALDAPVNAAAAALYVAIDGRRRDAIPIRYGRPKPSAPGFPTIVAGFTALVPTHHLDEGEHVLELLVVARNQRGYYVVPNALRFEVWQHEENEKPDEDELITPRGESDRLPGRSP